MVKQLSRLMIITLILVSLPVAAAAAQINNDDSEIGIMLQEYVGDNIAEILAIFYDGSQPALREFNYHNPSIEELNLTIRAAHQDRYYSFLNQALTDKWIEIRSYPFASKDYLQIVTTTATYPSYGTDGELVSYNFNKSQNAVISLEDALATAGLSNENLAEAVQAVYVLEHSGLGLSSVNATGFLIRQNDLGEELEFLIEATVENPNAEPWKRFFSYTPSTKRLMQLDNRRLFAADELFLLAPPLLAE